jgi:hypothetical protein
VIFVEILDRRGHVAGRVRVDALPFRVGRAYTADLVVDDPYVRPLHGVLDAETDGSVAWREVGGDAPPRAIDPGGEVDLRIGQTQLRLRDRDFAVPPALASAPTTGLQAWLASHWSAVPILVALVMATQLGVGWGNSWGKLEPAVFLPLVGWGGLVVLLWSGAWSLVTYLVRHQWKFVAHCTLTCLWAIADTLLEEAYQWGQFLATGIEPLYSLEGVVRAGIGGLLLFAQLGVAGVTRRGVRASIAGAVALAVFALTTLVERGGENRYRIELPYWSRIQSIDPRWLPSQPTDEFLAGTNALEEELAELARKTDP